MRVEEVKIEGISCGGSLHQEGVDGSCFIKEFVGNNGFVDNREFVNNTEFVDNKEFIDNKKFRFRFRFRFNLDVCF
jgi:hypothetical protein